MSKYIEIHPVLRNKEAIQPSPFRVLQNGVEFEEKQNETKRETGKMLILQNMIDKVFCVDNEVWITTGMEHILITETYEEMKQMLLDNSDK